MAVGGIMKSQKKLLLIIWGLVSGLLLIIGGFLSCFLFSTLVNYIIDSKVALLPGSEVSGITRLLLVNTLKFCLSLVKNS